MASNSSTQARRRNGRSPEDAVDLGIDVTRNAQETVIRALGTGADTALNVVGVNQQVGRELVSLTIAGTKQALRMSADVLGSVLDAFHPWAESQPASRGWHRLIDGSAHAFSRFTEEMQGTAEEGTERIKQAVDTMADRVKESAAELGQAAEEQSNRTSRAAAASSKSGPRPGARTFPAPYAGGKRRATGIPTSPTAMRPFPAGGGRRSAPPLSPASF